jgi:MtN3 and saliva related transmembrane protein
MVELLGLIAGMLTTFAFVPQVWRTWQTRSTNDLSMTMLVVFTTGVGLWVVYGIAIKSVPIILANVITLLLTIILVVFKFVL